MIGMARRKNANRDRRKTGPDGQEVGATTPNQPTIKGQREIKRTQKVEAKRRKQAKTKRNRSVGLLVGGITVVVAISLIIFIITNGRGKGALTIEGVQTFTGLTANHVNGTVNYQQTPPVGGDHSGAWLNCAVYADPVQNENALHSLEHGAVWITYDPTVITGEQLTTLRKAIPKTYVILSPYQGLPSPIVASAWGVQLKVSQVNDPRITEFISKYRESKSGPEPGAPCTGGIDGPGKLS